MKRSRRELSFNVVMDKFVFQNNQITVFPSFTFIPKTGIELPKTAIILLPFQCKHWHRAKNRLRGKTGFGMYNPQNVEKSGFGQSVCVSVCPSVLLSLFPRALTGVRFNRSS